MKLSFDMIRSAAFGIERIEEKGGKVQFFRFTKAEEDAYGVSGNVNFYDKTFTTAGVRLAFRTDTSTLAFSYDLEYMPSRPFAFFDVYVDGTLYRHFGSASGEVKSSRAEIPLTEGEKDIEIYLPWSAKTLIYDFEIDGGAFFTPIKRSKAMISYGDSITQGYDARYPSLSYASALSRLIDADAINKAIGGERFCPEILTEKNGNPDYVTVAYGINDWANYTYDFIKERSRAFYKRISELYPDSKIFVITPIRYLNYKNETAFGAPANTVDALLRENCADLPNVTVINGWYLTPELSDFYADFTLHPNDLGFGVYAENLYKEISKHLN